MAAAAQPVTYTYHKFCDSCGTTDDVDAQIYTCIRCHISSHCSNCRESGHIWHHCYKVDLNTGESVDVSELLPLIPSDRPPKKCIFVTYDSRKACLVYKSIEQLNINHALERRIYAISKKLPENQVCIYFTHKNFSGAQHRLIVTAQVNEHTLPVPQITTALPTT